MKMTAPATAEVGGACEPYFTDPPGGTVLALLDPAELLLL
jgi:hypothetical protein